SCTEDSHPAMMLTDSRLHCYDEVRQYRSSNCGCTESQTYSQNSTHFSLHSAQGEQLHPSAELCLDKPESQLNSHFSSPCHEELLVVSSLYILNLVSNTNLSCLFTQLPLH